MGRAGRGLPGNPSISWFDDTSKELVGDYRHRALRHHTTGIRECVEKFGETLTLSSGRVIPVRWVAEQHVVEDMGRLVTAADWLRCIVPDPSWMNRPRKLSRELKDTRHPEEKREKEAPRG